MIILVHGTRLAVVSFLGLIELLLKITVWPCCYIATASFPLLIRMTEVVAYIYPKDS